MIVCLGLGGNKVISLFTPFKVDCGTELLFDLEEIVDMWNRKGRRIAV